MDLPKNITQIGESDRYCKIYVEDYVISYIKQINQLAENKASAVALYGSRKEENGISYLFLYGAGKVETLQREVRHLSQAQAQETERIRKRHFPDYEFLGYRLLDGEMVEGFHICEQGICRYISGYACFYEKNDGMLAYMLSTRQEEVKPEEVNQEKYDQVRQRQEERRALHNELGGSRTSSRSGNTDGQSESGENGDSRGSLEERAARSRYREEAARKRYAKIESDKLTPRMSAARSMQLMRASVVGVFLLLCVVGLSTLNGGGGLKDLQSSARQFIDDLTEQKIPDADGATTVMNPLGSADTLVAEDKLADAIQQENAAMQNPSNEGESGQNQAPQGGTEGNTSGQSGEQSAGQSGEQSTGQSGEQSTGQSGEQSAGQSGEQSTGQSGEQSTGQSGEQSAGQSGEQSAEQSGGQQTEPSAQQPVTATPTEVQEVSSPVSYTIEKGDTLIGLSLRLYGTEERVKDICSLNNITNPDNIQIGQKILLP